MTRPTIIACNNNYYSADKGGFTLLALCFVTIILGSVAVMMLPESKTLLFRKTYQTESKLEQISKAVEIYYRTTSTLPCPARLDHKLGHADFGKSDCVTVSSNQIFMHGTTKIGAVPTRQLALSDDEAFDEWGNKIIYAIDSSTKPAAITVRDISDSSDIVNINAEPPIAMILSHGPDAVGAYSRAGTQLNSCSLTGATVNKSELENCNFSTDARFISATWQPSAANSYDDLQKLVYRYPTCPGKVPGCTLWLDAADSTSFTLTSGDVSVWRDKSGYGNDLSQGLFLLRPAYITGGINSKNSVRFDGLVGDYLNSSMVAPNFPYTIISVYKSGSAAGMIAGFNKILGLSVREGLIKNGASTIALTQGDGGLFPSFTISGTATAANPHIAIGVFSGSDASYTAQLITDGTISSNSSGTSRSQGSRQLNVGGITLLSLYLTGDIAEIIVYPRALTTNELDKINCHLSAKWAISVSTSC